jgi:hypothetical protein
VKLHVAEFASPDYGNISDPLYDPKIALCHGYIVSHRALCRQRLALQGAGVKFASRRSKLTRLSALPRSTILVCRLVI